MLPGGPCLGLPTAKCWNHRPLGLRWSAATQPVRPRRPTVTLPDDHARLDALPGCFPYFYLLWSVEPGTKGSWKAWFDRNHATYFVHDGHLYMCRSTADWQAYERLPMVSAMLEIDYSRVLSIGALFKQDHRDKESLYAEFTDETEKAVVLLHHLVDDGEPAGGVIIELVENHTNSGRGKTDGWCDLFFIVQANLASTAKQLQLDQRAIRKSWHQARAQRDGASDDMLY